MCGGGEIDTSNQSLFVKTIFTCFPSNYRITTLLKLVIIFFVLWFFNFIILTRIMDAYHKSCNTLYEERTQRYSKQKEMKSASLLDHLSTN